MKMKAERSAGRNGNEKIHAAAERRKQRSRKDKKVACRTFHYDFFPSHCQESTFNRMSQNGCQVKVREMEGGSRE